ncbi:UDP-N-acetylmuramate--L-alanine ligase [Alphaproteobacteria bacterium]|nr:UDP-N-acetylmuramate--L-alanine ligase [Alphaproteobacteria bacterium]
MISNKNYNNFTIHFVGIGGIGMSGIAELMIDLGYKIQGSDLEINSNIIRLKKRGIKFFKGHKKSNIKNITAVVFSSAIMKNNPELQECKRLSIPLVSRADMLAELMKTKKSIAIAGSHGKTTTTSLVGSIFDNAKFDPTIVNGGIINSYSKNNRFGKSEWMIVEADESDGTFLRLPHQINIITNLDLEHLDYYKTKENLIQSFIDFVNNLPFYGYSIICIDSLNLKKISNKIKTRKIITFSKKNENSDVKISTIKINKYSSKFSLNFKKGKINGIDGKFDFECSLLGTHNVLNATGAIIASLIANVPIKNIRDSIKNFQGVKRRFTFLGTINNSSIYDDYAHHPTEIKASYEIAKHISSKKNIVIFQPHRFSRTEYLFDDFIKVLKKIDVLYVLDIYAAGETPIKDINSFNLVKKIKKFNKHSYYLSPKTNIKQILKPYFKEKTNIIFMGAGSITYLAQKLFN